MPHADASDDSGPLPVHSCVEPAAAGEHPLEQIEFGTVPVHAEAVVVSHGEDCDLRGLLDGDGVFSAYAVALAEPGDLLQAGFDIADFGEAGDLLPRNAAADGRADAHRVHVAEVISEQRG